MCQINNINKINSPREILRMTQDNKAVDRTKLGINTPKTHDGLQLINEGFDFLQHNSINHVKS